MSERQVHELQSAIAELEQGDPSMVMIETTAANGDAVWIQILQGNVNAHYPFDDEPEARCQRLGIRTPSGTTLLGWEAGSYVTYDVGDASSRDVAAFVDRLFVALLGCDDDAYTVTSTRESLD